MLQFTRWFFAPLLMFGLIFVSIQQANGATEEPQESSETAQAPSVVFLSPDNSRFWVMVSGFMQAVADDLNVDLSIYTDLEKNRFGYRELLDRVLRLPEKPDYILMMCKEKVTHEMLSMIDAAGIKVLTFNTDVPPDEQPLTGAPREKLPHWIGHVSPNNHKAGQQLVSYLWDRHHQISNQPPLMIGLSGTRDSSAALDRNQGFYDALPSHPSKLNQIIFAEWSESEALIRTDRLLERHPDLDLIWSASDGMAIGAIRAIEQRGLEPGEDVLVGGVDWEFRALEEIEAGRLAASLGRHFMGGGLALLLINDFHHGYDFAEAGRASLTYDFEIITRNNLDSLRGVMLPERWKTLDFRRFSKTHQPDLRQKNQTASDILDEFVAHLRTPVTP